MSRQRSPHMGATDKDVNDQTESLQEERHPAPKNHAVHAAVIPQTSIERLMRATSQDDVDRSSNSSEPETVLYLAYGSNLCAETFRGKRGIRPLSQINVSAPTLELTLGLPGFPYAEPCFANVDFRKLPKKPEVPDLPNPPAFPPAFEVSDYSQGQWDGGLMGVVYEVTKEDYRQIMRTEGGGSGYQEIYVPCVALPPSSSIPEKPVIPKLPRPFIARTLCASSLPHGGRTWWQRLLSRPAQREPGYAEASARYLKLITDGAAEHSLPDAYQEWLLSMHPYTITSQRQKMGKLLIMILAGPPVLGFMTIAKWFADENGRYPPVVAAMMNFLFNATWVLYDSVLKTWFGDGERTEPGNKKTQGRRLSLGKPLADEEKTSLLRQEK